LSAGFGETTVTAQAREVQLAQRVGSVGKISHDAADECPAPSTRNPLGRTLE
jgi:hypothetical protein